MSTRDARETAGPIRDAADKRIAVATNAAYSDQVQLQFAAIDMPLTVSSFEFKSPELAIQWVKDKGLIKE